MHRPNGKSITAFAPATVANVACAFDILGFALESPGDKVIASVRPEPGVVISAIYGGGGNLSLDPKKNTAAVSIAEYLRAIEAKQGVTIELYKELPLGSGLGSSAASAVAGVAAANALFGSPLAPEELIPFVLEAEKVACGAAHADNGAPSLLGGFVLIRSYAPLDIVKIPSPRDLICTVVHPHLEVKTEDARRILKQKVSLRDAVTQWGNTAGLIAGLLQCDYGLISRSLQDVIIEPERADLIPGFYSVKAAALEAGALGCSISGSGPSVFALSTSMEAAGRLGGAMRAAFEAAGIGSESFISRISTMGARIIEG